MKLEFSTRLVALVMAIIAVLTLSYIYISSIPEPITKVEYYGVLVEFRADIVEAQEVPVYPKEDLMYRDVMHPLVKNVTIAFKDAGENNGIYIVEQFEIVNKMSMAYASAFARYEGKEVPTFDSIEVDKYDNLPGKIQNPIIAIVHPKFANETSIRNEGHVTTISGTTLEELDLAVVKFLTIVMGIDVEELQGA
jgi:hypothetical protein